MFSKTLLTSLFTNTTSKSAVTVTLSRNLSSGNKANTLIIGAPGSGKGTISNWIVRDFGLLHVSSGDILRAQMRDGTELGKAAKSFIGKLSFSYYENIFVLPILDKGDLVPDQVMVGLISSELKKLGSKAWLLDGFPR